MVIRLWLRRITLLLFVSLIGIWIASYWRSFSISVGGISQRLDVVLGIGSVVIEYDPDSNNVLSPHTGFHNFSIEHFRRLWGNWAGVKDRYVFQNFQYFHYDHLEHYYFVGLPLWFPGLITGLLGVWAFRRTKMAKYNPAFPVQVGSTQNTNAVEVEKGSGALASVYQHLVPQCVQNFRITRRLLVRTSKIALIALLLVSLSYDLYLWNQARELNEPVTGFEYHILLTNLERTLPPQPFPIIPLTNHSLDNSNINFCVISLRGQNKLVPEPIQHLRVIMEDDGQDVLHKGGISAELVDGTNISEVNLQLRPKEDAHAPVTTSLFFVPKDEIKFWIQIKLNIYEGYLPSHVKRIILGSAQKSGANVDYFFSWPEGAFARYPNLSEKFGWVRGYCSSDEMDPIDNALSAAGLPHEESQLALKLTPSKTLQKSDEQLLTDCLGLSDQSFSGQISHARAVELAILCRAHFSGSRGPFFSLQTKSGERIYIIPDHKSVKFTMYRLFTHNSTGREIWEGNIDIPNNVDAKAFIESYAPMLD